MLYTNPTLNLASAFKNQRKMRAREIAAARMSRIGKEGLRSTVELVRRGQFREFFLKWPRNQRAGFSRAGLRL